MPSARGETRTGPRRRRLRSVRRRSWNKVVRLKVDCISRLRPGAQEWNFYTDEDIEDGWLVFEGVDRFHLQNDGYVPNDLINDIQVVATEGEKVVVEVWVDAGIVDGVHHEAMIRVRCTGMHLEDPKRPGEKIL